MLKIAIGALMAALLLIPQSARADGDSACDEVVKGVWKCEIPEAGSHKPVRCKFINDVLLCSGPIGQERQRAADVVKPANCGWVRRQYRCW